MSQTLVLVHGEQPREVDALVSIHAAEFPRIKFVTSTTLKSLERALSSQRIDAILFVSSSGTYPSYLEENARRFPAIPFLLLGGNVSDSTPLSSVPNLTFSAKQEAVSTFLREDVLGAARGSFRGVALASVLQVLHAECKTCTLNAQLGFRTGKLVLRNGALVHAEYRDLLPSEAALELLSWEQTDVAFSPAPPPSKATIWEPLDFLLLEAARLVDERAQTGQERKTPHPTLPSLDWHYPELSLLSLDALLENIRNIPGTRIVELLDIEREELLARKVEEGETPIPTGYLVSLAQTTQAMARGLEIHDRVDEVVVAFSSRLRVFRPLHTVANIVLCVTFNPKEITLGLAKTKLSQVLEAFVLNT